MLSKHAACTLAVLEGEVGSPERLDFVFLVRVIPFLSLLPFASLCFFSFFPLLFFFVGLLGVLGVGGRDAMTAGGRVALRRIAGGGQETGYVEDPAATMIRSGRMQQDK